MKKHWFVIAVNALILSVVIFHNGCSAEHSSSSLSSLDVCLPELEPGVKPLYNFLSGQASVGDAASPRFLSCKNCHNSGGGGRVPFADGNFGVALNGFAGLVQLDVNKIYTKVYDSGHAGGAGGAGPENATALDPLKSGYFSAVNNFKTCLTKDEPVAATISTTAKTIAANQTTAIDLTWNLGTDMLNAKDAIAGGIFKITIQATASATGIQGYKITAPSALGSSTKAIRIRKIQVMLNNQLVSADFGGSSWEDLDNYAPANNATTGRTTPYLLAQGTGFMQLQADTSLATNTIAFRFADIAESNTYPDFNPTTYARLTAAANNAALVPPLLDAERVFTQRCQTCHNATKSDGGISLATGANALGLLKLTAVVIPYSPNASIMHSAMTATDSSIMPPTAAPTGAATPTQIRWVRDWILDGAR